MRFFYYVLLASSLFFSSALQGQITYNPAIGASGANSGGFGKLAKDARVGLHAGLGLRIGDGKLFTATGLYYHLFTADTFEQGENAPAVRLDAESRIHSIRVPIMLGYRFLHEEDFLLGFHLKGGVAMAYHFSTAAVSAFPLEGEDLNRFNFGPAFGLGVDIFFVTLDFFYEKGMINLFHGEKSKNNIFTGMLGVRF